MIKKDKYCELKNLDYYAYDFYTKASPDKAEDLKNGFLAKYESDEEKEIFKNTLEFPFDLELCTYLNPMKLSDSNLNDTSVKFNISIDLLKSKIKEYVSYSYTNTYNEGSFDNNIISELSNLYQNNLNPEQKNSK